MRGSIAEADRAPGREGVEAHPWAEFDARMDVEDCLDVRADRDVGARREEPLVALRGGVVRIDVVLLARAERVDHDVRAGPDRDRVGDRVIELEPCAGEPVDRVALVGDPRLIEADRRRDPERAPVTEGVVVAQIGAVELGAEEHV